MCFLMVMVEHSTEAAEILIGHEFLVAVIEPIMLDAESHESDKFHRLLLLRAAAGLLAALSGVACRDQDFRMPTHNEKGGNNGRMQSVSSMR